jgi:hypothetical protein
MPAIGAGARLARGPADGLGAADAATGHSTGEFSCGVEEQLEERGPEERAVMPREVNRISLKLAVTRPRFEDSPSHYQGEWPPVHF